MSTTAPREGRVNGPAGGVAGTSGRRAGAGRTSPFGVLRTARTRADLIYRAELDGHDTIIALTDEQPPEWDGRTGRIDSAFLAETAWPAAERPLVYICGPTGFVEAIADALVRLGHDPSRIRTERFGPT